MLLAFFLFITKFMYSYTNYYNTFIINKNAPLYYRFCTSIVSQDSNGQIWHSRNLDYPFTGMLQNITIAVDLQKGGKVMLFFNF